jgi:AcrR family transcriptional regulator
MFKIERAIFSAMCTRYNIFMPEPTSPSPPPKLGLRERSKIEKRRRIKLSARAVFLEKGYEAATTREIAERADVAIGTLFVYAKDKRDLLMLIINDDLDQLNADTAEATPRGPLIDQLTEFFRRRYQYWASEPRLARPAVQETFDFLSRTTSNGPETARFYARRSKIMDMLSAIIAAKQSTGKIASAHGAEEIASLFMTIYLTEVRRWLNTEQPEVEAGIARLRTLMSLALTGVQPAAGEAGP